MWGTILFALATCCRSNAIYLLLFTAWAIFRLFLTNPGFVNAFKSILTGLSSIFIVGITLYSLTFYIGYELYCRNNETIEKPAWCFEKFPNIYSHIQSKYWQVGFLRTWRGDERVFRSAAWWSLPYNIFAIIAIIYGIRKYDWKIITPYLVYFTFLLLTILLVANAEINTRVCASAPIVYWIFARFNIEADQTLTKSSSLKEKILAYLKKYGFISYCAIYFIAEMILVPTFIGWI